ncbi:MAG: Bax inhibitor-1/YccA family protein, partial [Candidatus Omnitrophica bacterium]|nr:Bax inhibitor-1/YccA family protein [Candidatus Omnitrophota bacterium]
IGGIIFALITIFKKEWSMYTAPVYAVCEGLVLGGLSAIFEMQFPGIVMQAVALTFGTLFCLLMAYKSGLIRVTDKFRLGVVAATGAIALVYLVSWILGFFHVSVPFIQGNSIWSIGFSLVVVGIASMNLVLDFDMIDRGAEAGAPKYMEWYCAFGLMVTLIWLYMEILRLLSKLRSRN